MDVRRIEVSLSQDKINQINSAFQKELDYWKEAALENLDENEANQLKDSAPPSLLLIRKAKKNNAKKVDISEIILYLKSQYSTNNRNQIVFIQDFPTIEEVSSFEGIKEELRMVLKHIKVGENISLRNKVLSGGWIAVPRMAQKRDKLIKVCWFTSAI